MQSVGPRRSKDIPSKGTKEEMAEAVQRELIRQRSMSTASEAISENEGGDEEGSETDFFCLVLKGKIEVRKTRKTELRQSILSQTPMDFLRSRGMTEGSLKRAKMGKLVTVFSTPLPRGLAITV